jgi:hypothetical protein
MLARQSFQRHVGLYLRMKLLGSAVIMVQKHCLEGLVCEGSPAGINFHFRNQQGLSFFRSPFGNIENNARKYSFNPVPEK